MPTYPINAKHRLLLEDGTSFLLLEDNTSKVILDEAVALDDPLTGATGVSVTPLFSFAGEHLSGQPFQFEFQVDTVNTFDSQ